MFQGVTSPVRKFYREKIEMAELTTGKKNRIRYRA